ncbi:hypothetical protein C8R45DRAFT_1133118 [Mycena sanguinolenta]|nr:hypothetical protein C8R45DRAFT_1133118 [Mycena sanguinolenta]
MAYRSNLPTLSPWTITDRVPVEILNDIVVALPTKDQLSLCRVSQFWNELCLPVITRVVVLRNFARAKIFLEGILKKPDRADAIRSFSVEKDVYYGFRNAGDGEFPILLLNAIKLTIPRLRCLSVSPDILGPDYLIILEQCTFPSLFSYSAVLYFERLKAEMLIPFLERHPGLTHVHASVETHAHDKRADIESRAVSEVSRPLRVHIPSLQRFEGDAEFVAALVTQQLCEARLHWHGKEDIEQTVIALRSLMSPDTPLVSINNGMNTRHQCTPFVEALATHIPNLETLHMRAAVDWGLPEQETLDHLTTQLPRFRRLRYLALEDSLSDSEEFSWERDGMHAIVSTWANVCPTLEACCIRG